MLILTSRTLRHHFIFLQESLNIIDPNKLKLLISIRINSYITSLKFLEGMSNRNRNVQQLKSFPFFQNVSLINTDINSQGLENLEGLHFSYLDLSYSRHIRVFPNIQKTFPNLKSFNLAESDIHDDSLQSLEWSARASLDLSHCKITDEGIEHLIPLKSLKN